MKKSKKQLNKHLTESMQVGHVPFSYRLAIGKKSDLCLDLYAWCQYFGPQVSWLHYDACPQPQN